MFYPVKTPWWLRRLYPSCIWEMPDDQQAVYLCFDDGPDPEETVFVLDSLRNHGVKATFFCIGKNVIAYPEIYQRIIREGHSVGNHTHNHLSGWKVSDNDYFDDVLEAGKYIDTNLFRPPYGRATRFQMQCLGEAGLKMKIIMWSVLSGDFDINLTPQQCFENVRPHLKPGSIITFHDSRKASPRLRYALPEVLKIMAVKELVGKGL